MTTLDMDGAVALIRAGRGVGAALFADAAQRISGAEIRWFGGSQAVAALSDRDVLIDGSSLNESAVGASIVHDKHLTKQFLLDEEIRMPRGVLVRSADEAVSAADGFTTSVVVKPAGGGLGRGVSVDVRGEEEVRSAYAEAVRRRPQAVLVEEHIDIEAEYRCMATDRRCVTVVHRVLPFVVGDGRSSISELVRRKNLIRRENPAVHNLPIPQDHVLDRALGRQGLDRESVLEDGATVTVRNVGGLSGGGEPHERSCNVGPELKELAHRAVAAIPKLRWAGVDIVTERGTGTPYVIEINVRAGYGAATFPLQGEPVDVASVAWDMRLGLSSPEDQVDDAPPARHSEPPSLERSLAGKWNAGAMPLTRAFFARAADWGHRIAQRRGEVLELHGPDGVGRWFGVNGAHPEELLTARRIVRIHRHVRALLHLRDLRRSRGRSVRGRRQIERFLADRSCPILAIPARSSWDPENTLVLHGPDDVDRIDDQRRWYLQERPERRRLRVFASRTRGLAVTASSGQDLQFSDAQLTRACAAAVQAVRAVPELTWAAVDLYMGRDLSDGDATGRAFVEGLAMNPVLTADELLLNGAFDDLFALMLRY